MGAKSYPIEIYGKQFSLCYTVKVTREIDKKYGGIENMPDALKGKAIGEALSEILDVLIALMRGGYDHEKALAAFSGEAFDELEPPSKEVLENLYTIEDIVELQNVIFGAAATGQKTDIKLEEQKNVKATPET